MFKQIFSILSIFSKSFFDFKSGALKYIIYTGITGLLIFGLVMFGIWKFSDGAGAWIASLIPWEWAKNSVIFSLLIAMGVIFVFWILMRYLMLIIMSPMLSLVSEKAEQTVTGVKSASTFSFAGSAARSIRINLRNLLKEMLITILLFFLGLIPGINIFAIVFLLVVQAYFTGFGFMDFYLERHLSFKETVAEVSRHKWAAIALGSIFTIIFIIPVLGVIIAPYFATITATKYFSLIRSEEIS